MHGLHNMSVCYAGFGASMRTKRPNHGPILMPEIVDGMCGRCEFWHPMIEEEGGECAALAVWHLRGDRVKKKRPPFDDSASGPLVKAVHERTAAADDGMYWDETGDGEIVPAEDFSGIPRTYYDDRGEKRRVWSPLRTHDWFGCSRWSVSAIVKSRQPISEQPTTGQLSLFGDVA